MKPVTETTRQQGDGDAVSRRAGNRRRVRLPGRLTWRDASGTLRFASVITRDLSDTDVFVECHGPASIPLFRLVHFQLERGLADSMDVPPALRRDAKVLSAVYRVGPRASATGTPGGYALRMLVEPSARVSAPALTACLAVAN
jgi:hypothetical protein